MNILEVRNLSKKYPKFSLEDFSFDIPEGSIVGFIGRNGAGKTTTLKGIMGLICLDGGKISFLGKDMKENETEIKKEIGFTLSDIQYYPNFTIKKVVEVTKRFYPSFSDEKFAKLCNLFSIDINKKFQELSSGMKVKYSLAIALSHNAKLLILDEPTSGLDPISRDEILDIFKRLVKNNHIAILFSTHITSDLEKCADRIIYIHEGKKVFEGTKLEFVSSYILVSGKEEDESQIEDLIIAKKENDGTFEALISASEEEKLLSLTKFSIKKPNLDEVMIYLERGKDHEEFIL